MKSLLQYKERGIMYTRSFSCDFIAIPDFVLYNIVNYTKLTKVLKMDNNSMFLNIIAEWFRSHGLPYLTEFEAMLILLAALFVLVFIFWLVFRNLRLWYWKTDIRVETLKSIDARLYSVEERLSQGILKVAENTEKEATAHDGAERSSETVPENAVNEYAGRKAIGRSGRIYTEAELELQIRE